MHFLDDIDKMRDFVTLTKEEFLEAYSYLTEAEYNETQDAYAEIADKASPEIVEPTAEKLTDEYPVKLIERAYRTCYQSTNKMCDGSESLIKRCLYPENGGAPHTSPLEHVAVSLECDAIVTAVIASASKAQQYSYLQITGDRVVGNLRAFWDCWHWLAGNSSLTTAVVLNRAFAKAFPAIFKDEFKGFAVDFRTVEDPIRLPASQFNTFRIVTTRDILQEFARHRALSFSVESTRYCNYLKRGTKVVRPVPYDWAYEPENPQFNLWYNNCQAACINYALWLKAGGKPEEARMILPGSMKTEFIVSGFTKGWNNFLDLRLDKTAHPQIRLLAEQIKELLEN